MTEALHEYRAVIHGGHRASVVVQGRREFVEQFIPRREFPALFGGFILSRTADSEQEFLGVWGARKASRFRSLLRERGAFFSLQRHELPPFSPKIFSASREPNEPGIA